MSINFGIVENSVETLEKITNYVDAGMDTTIDVVSDL
jgi:hypothetical protein